MEPPLPFTDDCHLAAILAVGLHFRVLRIQDAIRWADQEIEQRPEPPSWLIDVSLSNSKELPPIDVRRRLEGIGSGANAEAVCTGIYSLVPDISGHTYEQCHAVARLLYHITRTVLRGDFSSQLLKQMVTIDELFDGWRYGTNTHEELMALLRDFIESKRDETISNRLNPITFVIPEDVLEE